jgi:hypothetical protein
MSQLNKSPIIETPVTDQDQYLDAYKCDIVFSFDCTGSMSSIIDSVRQNLVETIDKLFIEIPGIRIGILAHADYCDYPRMFWKIELCNSPEKLKEFIKNVPNGGGGDSPECYELAIQQANLMKWRSEIKVFVIIGDELPHEEGYEMPHLMPGFDSELHINWRTELQKMIENKITCFSCHALASENDHSVSFYRELSEKTGGYYIPLIELGSFNQYMVGICLRAADTAENFEAVLEHQRKLLEELKVAKAEDKKKLEEDLINTQDAIYEARNTSFFASPRIQTIGTAIKSKNGYTNSRIKSYETELKMKNADRSTSVNYFFDTLNRTSSEVEKVDPKIFTSESQNNVFKTISTPMRTAKRVKTRMSEFSDITPSETDTQEPW